MTIIGTPQPTRFYLARCAACVCPVRGESPALDCPECGQRLKAERLFAVTRDGSCNGKCMSAVRPDCSCSCGGENHGARWGLPTYTTEETESELRAYRARVAREKAEAEKRAEAAARAKRRAFDRWAEGRDDIVTYLKAAYDNANDFVDAMADLIRRSEPLTERQETAVRRCMDYDRRRAEIAEQRAREAAEAKPVPTGKAITVEGTVVHTRSDEHYFGEA